MLKWSSKFEMRQQPGQHVLSFGAKFAHQKGSKVPPGECSLDPLDMPHAQQFFNLGISATENFVLFKCRQACAIIEGILSKKLSRYAVSIMYCVVLHARLIPIYAWDWFYFGKLISRKRSIMSTYICVWTYNL